MTPLVRAHALGSFVALCALSANAASPLPNWKNFAELDTIQIVTADDDKEHSPRETTIWLAVHEDQGYIRTGSTTWGANVRREPNVVIIMDGVKYELRATSIPEGELYDAVKQAFRDKYGLMDAALSLFRGIGGSPTIMRLDGRLGIPMGN
jgi:hypothetical protein